MKGIFIIKIAILRIARIQFPNIRIISNELFG